MANKKFNDLVLEFKDDINYKCTPEDFQKLMEFREEKRKESKEKKTDLLHYGYFVLVIFMVIVVILYLYNIYSNIKPRTDIIDAINDPKNKSDGMDFIETEVEYDEQGNQIVYVDE